MVRAVVVLLHRSGPLSASVVVLANKSILIDLINMGPFIQVNDLLVKVESLHRFLMGAMDQYGITAAQCRMARAALRWSNIELARRAKVGRGTIVRIEGEQGLANPATLSAIRRAFEDAGIEFVEDYGVNFRTQESEA